MESLDNILSRSGEAVPEDKQETTQQTETPVEQTTEQQAETTETERAADGKPAPIGAIRQAEREKATKRYTEQVAEFDKKFDDYRVTTDRRFTELLQALKPQQQPQPKPDWFADPDAAGLHLISQAVSPEFERLNGVMLHNSQLIASQLHTADAVQAADQAFAKAVASRQIDPADYHRVLSSPNVYDAAVKWHKRQQALQEIGDDPAAYKERLKAEILAEANGAQQAVQNGAAQSAPVMPSNLAAARNVGARSGPAWAGPKPLADIFKR